MHQINYADQLSPYLDKPIRVYHHAGELLAVGTFHGGMLRERPPHSARTAGVDFIMFFGATNWQLVIPDGQFHVHDIYVEEIKPELEENRDS